jgi:hypothetical protein
MRALIVLLLSVGFTPGPRVAIPAVPQGKLRSAVNIVVKDESGAPIQDELLILQDLNDHQREMGRALSDKNGEISTFNVGPGLYRAIATTPYGLWQTQVREFLVNDIPVQLELVVQPMPTHGNGDIVLVGAEKLLVTVLDSDRHPVVAATVLARDREATLYLERWYKTDQSGGAAVEVVGDPLVLVVIFGKTLVTREISSKSTQQIIQLPRP